MFDCDLVIEISDLQNKSFPFTSPVIEQSFFLQIVNHSIA
jgi:hypothetical protein